MRNGASILVAEQNASPIGVIGAGGQANEMSSYCPRPIRFYAVEEQYLRGEQAPLVRLDDPDEESKITEVVIAVGAPGLRRELREKWPGTRFATIVADSADCADSVSLGEGTVIAPKVFLSASVCAGIHVLVNSGSIVSHDTALGDYVTISPGVTIGGHVRVGNGVFVGIGATIRDGVVLGEGAVVGAGAVVLRDVEPFEVVAGVPARRLRFGKRWMREI